MEVQLVCEVISENMILKTDAKGKFSAEIPEGFYDLFVSSATFSPQCRKIRIKKGDVVTFNPRLSPDPLVIDELGDRFPTK